MVVCIIVVFIILMLAFIMRQMALADGCCGNCTKYSNCYRNHPEYLKQNTLDHPCCKDYKV